MGYRYVSCPYVKDSVGRKGGQLEPFWGQVQLVTRETSGDGVVFTTTAKCRKTHFAALGVGRGQKAKVPKTAKWKQWKYGQGARDQDEEKGIEKTIGKKRPKTTAAF